MQTPPARMAKKRRMQLTDEERQVRRERMTKMWESKRMAAIQTVQEEAIQSGAAPKVEVVHERPPEVQAVLDSMTPERRARLQMIQARQLQTREGQAALARHEAEKIAVQTETVNTSAVAVLERQKIGDPNMVLPPSRIGSREVSIIERTNGEIVSQYGPCICGRPKREWHMNCSRR